MLPDPEEEESEELDDANRETMNKKRQTSEPEITQEDDDEEIPEEDGDEGNQYLQKPAKSNSSIANIGNGSAKRSATKSGANGSSFGARINRSNATSQGLQSPGRRVQTEKPKFTMHFQMGTGSSAVSTTESSAISDQLITDLVNDPSFSGDKATTSYGVATATSAAASTTTSSPLSLFNLSTERFDVLDTSTEEEDLFERSRVSFCNFVIFFNF